jgi:Cu2+-exporting ATPase
MASAAAAHLRWQQDGDHARTLFFAEGMRCANCANAIRRRVGELPGVERIDVNLATSRVSLAWQPSKLDLGTALAAIEKLGFRPVPLSGEHTAQSRDRERRLGLKRIGVAGLVSMQMSMYTVGLYAGAFSGIDADMEALLRVTSMLLALPVLLYSGAPFLRGAWMDIRRRSLGMDTPVALAPVLAFVASAWNTFTKSGEVYYDSIGMFVFLLLLGRYIEQKLRRGSLDASEALARSLPTHVSRVGPDGGSTRVPIADVVSGDRMLIAHGAVVPVDATLDSGAATLDEALITGESVPVSHRPGEVLLGGSVNLGAPIHVTARSRAQDSTLANMSALIERAQAERPPMAMLAERAAVSFVTWILLLAAVVCALWLYFDPSRAFAAVLSVLVVTCPCALSLATPAAGRRTSATTLAAEP